MCLLPVLGLLPSPAGTRHPHAEGLGTQVAWLPLTPGLWIQLLYQDQALWGTRGMTSSTQES